MPKERRTKRLSGAAYRFERLKKEKERNKLKDSLTKYFDVGLRDQQDSSSSQSLQLSDPLPSSNEGTPIQIEEKACASTSTEKSEVHHGSDEDHQLFAVLDADPGKWPQNISAQNAKSLTISGPHQLKQFNFPANHTGRKFSPNYYTRKLNNGETVSRNWLLYSITKDAVYCFCCKIFGKDEKLNMCVGVQDWQHLSIILTRHEKSNFHNENINRWLDLSKRISKKTTVNEAELRLLDAERQHWRSVIEILISLIKYLGRQCLAFQGHSNKLFDLNNGNFLKGVEMIAEFNPDMREHLRRIQVSQDSEKQRMPFYLGDKIQNEIIDLIGSKIRQTILNDIRTSKYFSIILDSTPDISHIEQLTVIIRFVHLNQEQNKVEIRENFLTFCAVNDTTGKGLCDTVLNFLSELKLNVDNIRGQGYDNGSNMKGKHNGLQKRLLDVNSRAFFVPCAAHSLNLVVNDAANISHETVSFFGLLQELFVFFSSSVKRWSVLKTHIENLNIKSVSETRWSSRIDAIKPLRYNLKNVLSALEEIINSDTNFDFSTKHSAQVLYEKIYDYSFICSIMIWYEILFQVNITSKIVQDPKSDIKSCIENLQILKQFFINFRSDTKFDNIIQSAKELAENLGLEAQIGCTRRRKKKRLFNYESEDETVNDPELAFKTNFFFCILDQALSSVVDRFESLNQYYKVFGFLYCIFQGPIEEHNLLIECKNLQSKLTDPKTDEGDVDAVDLCDEIKNFKNIFDTQNLEPNPQAILQYIFENELICSFPNLTIALRLLLTLPVSVATGERSFSKLKIVKNYLRANMSQERLSNLAIISIEAKILDTINTEDIIKDFAEKKARKANFV